MIRFWFVATSLLFLCLNLGTSVAAEKLGLVAPAYGAIIHGNLSTKIAAQTSESPIIGKVKEVPQLRKLSDIESKQLDTLAKFAVEATNSGDFATAEVYWAKIIQTFPGNAAAWSNRGNARVSQNLLVEAIADYDQSIALAPEALDPYLNRGTAYEGLQRWQEAIADYNYILAINPKDAMAFNNRGNAQAGLGNWQEAIADYRLAADLSPNFAFARANYALALYETGQTEEAIRQMRNILRKYPDFPDVRAAYAVALWAQQKTGEAESNWAAVENRDRRYGDLNWIKNIRRWPPAITQAMENFLQLKS